MHYTALGSGPGLGLVHGTGADSVSNFGPLVDRFTDRRTVITPDVPFAELRRAARLDDGWQPIAPRPERFVADLARWRSNSARSVRVGEDAGS